MLSDIRFLGGVHSKNKLSPGAVLHKLKLCENVRAFCHRKRENIFDQLKWILEELLKFFFCYSCSNFNR